MTAPMHMPVTSFVFPWMIGGGVVAVALSGALLLQRGPVADYWPDLAPHPVVLGHAAPLHVMKFEVTVAEWNRCHDDGICEIGLSVRPDQSPQTTPATGISYVDAGQYIAWLNDRTNGSFRLPSVEEWAFMADGVVPDEPDPIFTDPDLTWASAYILEEQSPRALRPQGAFETSPAGISDLNGSVWEWTSNCYAGSAGATDDRCPAYFVAGEHIAAMSFLVRDPARGGCAVGSPPAHLGLRLVAEEPQP